MYYSLLKNILFRLNPETAHSVTLRSLRLFHQLHLSKYFPKIPAVPRTVMGLNFPNPVGLAAGLDKNGDYIDALAALGFGFIEVGTVTPQPQAGNPSPRLFRLPEHQAIINRLGFNNKGVDYLARQLQNQQFKGILGVNIGKGRETPIEHAIEDYLYCFRRVVNYASYITINISSPNTQGLRDLQQGDRLQNLLSALKQEQKLFLVSQKKYVPLVVKIAPDLTDEELQTMAQIFLAEKIDGVIASNTTLSRIGIEDSLYAKEVGGLSGKPLSARSTDIIRKMHLYLSEAIPIIASGGVVSEQDALDKLAAGASLVQIYSGFIYRGPGFIRDICAAL